MVSCFSVLEKENVFPSYELSEGEGKYQFQSVEETFLVELSATFWRSMLLCLSLILIANSRAGLMDFNINRSKIKEIQEHSKLV